MTRTCVWVQETRITGLVVNGTSGHVATRENLAVFMRQCRTRRHISITKVNNECCE